MDIFSRLLSLLAQKSFLYFCSRGALFIRSSFHLECRMFGVSGFFKSCFVQSLGGYGTIFCADCDLFCEGGGSTIISRTLEPHVIFFTAGQAPLMCLWSTSLAMTCVWFFLASESPCSFLPLCLLLTTPPMAVLSIPRTSISLESDNPLGLGPTEHSR